MTDLKKIPKIRFNTSMSNWQSRQFEKVFTDIPNNTLSRAELNYDTGIAKNLHYGDILIKFGELLDVRNNQLPYITDEELALKYKKAKLENGDIIIADAAEDESVGKCTEVLNLDSEIVIAGLHTIPVRPITSYAPKYLGYYMNSPAYHNQLLRLMQGTKVLSISKSAIRNTVVSSPIDNAEQSQIGSYFQNLDKLIALHQKKHDKLVILKKAMLEKMFPKNGTSVPEIRFKGFEGEWKENSLGKITDCFSGGTPSVGDSTFYGGKIPFIRSGEINSYSTELHITESGLNNSSAKMVEKGDILYALYGATSGEVGISNINGAINQAVLAIKPNDNFDNRFISYLLRKQKKQIVSTYLQGGQGNLSGNIIKNLMILTPTYAEQKKIGKYFNKLDQSINLQQKQLEKLKTIKKACLAKMFV
ncbi:MAG: restriction endonuclease subunit S [Carboxylicivirga sp.]|jgi:type I restriction enzyme S subunit|nr:restriction endonuclease subunit S [Carboxylicivirga sp.]